jgi:hypothetical protein
MSGRDQNFKKKMRQKGMNYYVILPVELIVFHDIINERDNPDGMPYIYIVQQFSTKRKLAQTRSQILAPHYSLLKEIKLSSSLLLVRPLVRALGEIRHP